MTEKSKAIICISVGELGWEILRTAPHALWTKYKKHNGNVRLIVMTRKDRFDLYGNQADILVPLEIKGDYNNLQPDCFRLIGLPISEYKLLNNRLIQQYSPQYQIVETIIPAIEKRRYTEKGQFNRKQMHYNFKPRLDNYTLIDSYITKDRRNIVIAPRYRTIGKKRNWNNWKELYDKLEKDKYLSKFNYIICGKKGEYIPDVKNRFVDINNIEQTNNTSLIGLTIAAIESSVLTIGSQSGLPNLSNLLETPTLQFGDEKNAHAKTYNVKNTQTTFIEDGQFNISTQTIMNELTRILKEGKRK